MSTQAALFVLVVAPLFLLWVVAIFHIVLRRPDLSIARKWMWSAVVIVLGYAGLLVYTMFRPPWPVTRTGADNGTASRAALGRLRQLIEDHAAGSISDEEYARDKAALFGLDTAAS